MAVKTFFCIDAHTCGNPVRLVAGGGLNLIGANMSEKRQHFLREYDWIRHALMFEPRGHDMMSGSILYSPHEPENDVPAFLAAENLEVECPELGSLRVDVAYGGNFYAIVDPQTNFPGLEHFRGEQLIG